MGKMSKDEIRAFVKDVLKESIGDFEIQLPEAEQQKLNSVADYITTLKTSANPNYDDCPECHKHTLKPNGKHSFVCVGENCGDKFEVCPNGDCRALIDVSKPKKYSDGWSSYFCPECHKELDMSEHLEDEE